VKINEGINQDKDPICGMSINLEKAKYKSTYNGNIYGFCSTNCKDKFDKDPDPYV